MNVYIRDLSRALTCLDMSVDIYTRARNGFEIVEYVPGVRVISVPGGQAGNVTKHDIANMVPALIRGIDEVALREATPYDLVHSHYWISGMAGQRLATRWNVPHVQMFHTLSRIKTKYANSAIDPRRERTEIRLLQTSDAIVVSNPIERVQLLELYPNQCAHLASIPCGIDVNAFHPRLAPEPGKAKFTIVALGRLERLKNFGLLLEAVAIACSRDARFEQQIEVLVAGGPSTDEPEEAERLRTQVRSLNIKRVIRFRGAVPRDDIPSLYAAADVCVVPSLHESFGLVALEAMASGLPVIATRSGGMQMTVVNGVSGFLVDPGDPSEMAERLLTLWASPVVRHHMGVRGARAAQHYAWPVVAERMQCLYHSLVCACQSSYRWSLARAQTTG
jgi:D-inositol-3-phosphate glycosyltransferase